MRRPALSRGRKNIRHHRPARQIETRWRLAPSGHPSGHSPQRSAERAGQGAAASARTRRTRDEIWLRGGVWPGSPGRRQRPIGGICGATDEIPLTQREIPVAPDGQKRDPIGTRASCRLPCGHPGKITPGAGSRARQAGRGQPGKTRPARCRTTPPQLWTTSTPPTWRFPRRNTTKRPCRRSPPSGRAFSSVTLRLFR